MVAETRTVPGVTAGYNAYGRLTSYTRRTYPAFAMGYNGLDQPSAVTAGTALRRFVYDDSGWLIGGCVRSRPRERPGDRLSPNADSRLSNARLSDQIA